MTKLLIFTNDENCDQQENGFNLFSYLSITRPVSFPVYLSASGKVELLNDADIIILPDVDIIANKIDWETCYDALKTLRDSNVSLLIVKHTNGWDYRKNNTTDEADTHLKEYLCKQPDISASHVSDDFYCNELKAIAEAIKKNCELSYQQALQTAKEKFGNPLLEAKLELLHALLVPPENLKTIEENESKWRRQLKLTQNDKDGEGHIKDWTNFKNSFNAGSGFASNPFNPNYIKSLAEFRDNLLKKDKKQNLNF